MPGGPDIPKAPKAETVVKEQTKANQQAAQSSLLGSAIDQNNIYGKIDYKVTGKDKYGNPIMSVNTSLSPEQQKLYDAIMGTKQTASAAGRDLIAGAGYDVAPDLSTAENSIVSQNLGRFTDYLNPYFSQQSESLDAQLRNQGLVPGSEAYDKAKNNLMQSQNQTVSGFLSQMQPEAYRQAVNSYQLPMQTAAALTQLGMYTDPTATQINTPQANYQPANATGAYQNQYQNDMARYEAEQARYSEMLGGIAKIGGTILGGPIGSMAAGSLFGSGNPGGASMPWQTATSVIPFT